MFGASRRSTAAALAAATVAVGVLAAGSADAVSVAAAAPGQVGNDISYPQCPVAQGGYGNPPPRPQA